MSARADHHKPLVLIVEDDELLRLLSRLELVASGFRTLEAGTADEAVAILDQCSSIDAIFTDIAMPGSMNGLALARLVGSERPNIYVLMTSGDTLPDAGPVPEHSDFVRKPYAMPQIAQMIRSHLPPGADRKLSS
jgi:two-component system, response regulator PdtaR